MLNNQKNELNNYLLNVTKSLDISESQQKKAQERYDAIGEWLGREESIIHYLSPSMYPQGSFLLGTVTKPLSEKDEYDVDLVCEVKISKTSISQKTLKQVVGFEVKKYNEENNFKKPTKEGKRCWTLEYAESARFHMDILPAVPDGTQMKATLENLGFDTTSQTDLAIAITDNTLPNYDNNDSDWPVSNPRGYAEWFKSKMEVQFKAGLEMLAEARRADVADIPEYAVKTPLQRAVQLLKRHRDIMFEHDWDNKPISIIITTLAAQTYNNEDNVLEALTNIVAKMDNHILESMGEIIIPNPVNPRENFADKWPANPKLKDNFYRWLAKIKIDFNTAFLSEDVKGLAQSFENSIGKTPAYDGYRAYENSQVGVLNEAVVGITSFLSNMANCFLPKYDVSHREQPNWKSMLYRDVSIRGEIRINDRWIEFKSTEKNLPKGCKLRFFATTDAIGPYQAYWQIVNTGAEAQMKECLRGKINLGTAGKGGLVRYEETWYTGMHWVECFIVKDDLLIARSGPFEVNIG